MRVIGPKVKFIHKERGLSGTSDVYGQEYTFTDGETFYGVINDVPSQPDGQNMFNGKVGVQIHYRMRTMYTDLAEEDRVKMSGTSRVFDIVKVGDLLEQGVYKVVDLHERKE